MDTRTQQPTNQQLIGLGYSSAQADLMISIQDELIGHEVIIAGTMDGMRRQKTSVSQMMGA